MGTGPICLGMFQRAASSAFRPIRRVLSNKVASESTNPIPEIAGLKFREKHCGPDASEIQRSLSVLGYKSEEEFLGATFKRFQLLAPQSDDGITEMELGKLVEQRAEQCQQFRSYIGQGFYGTHTPAIIRRSILENPMWYTSYTPYQAEISQGRLEALFNFQTLICELTGFDHTNASLLDEGSAAVEAMMMLYEAAGKKKSTILVSRQLFTTSQACLVTRSESLGLHIKILEETDDYEDAFGALFQYPGNNGQIDIDTSILSKLKAAGVTSACGVDPLAMVLLQPPASLGFDIAFGSSQRYGLSLGGGGPHSAFIACTEGLKRRLPGRIVGLTKDARGLPAYRLALQAREQHIRRGRAGSNICTSQTLNAIASGMFAVYHGPVGLRRIAENVHRSAVFLSETAARFGHKVRHSSIFDTVVIDLKEPEAEIYHSLAESHKVNLRRISPFAFGFSVDETVSSKDVQTLVKILCNDRTIDDGESIMNEIMDQDEPTQVFGIPDEMKRLADFLQQKVFTSHQGEADFQRYAYNLASKDISPVSSMVPLGSCTMKMNSPSILEALGRPEFITQHPMAPSSQRKGLTQIMYELEEGLKCLTGLARVCLHPNSGAQGEYLSMIMIRKAIKDRGIFDPPLCLIPPSAHGTNPASAKLAGFNVIDLKIKSNGEIDLGHLHQLQKTHGRHLGAIMVTFPSTYGILDYSVVEACMFCQKHGIFVFMDGANFNAIAGLIRPGDFGVDACHLNLHKTFGIPHGGGGPGAGPIAV